MQVIKVWIKWVGLFCIFLQSCIYDYNPKLDKYEDLLVVYGVITNEYGPHEIILSRTTSVYGSSSSPETKALISILDDDGNTVNLIEKGNGKYNTPADFIGVIGHQYKISIKLASGKHYESDFVKLIDVPEIKQLNSEYTTKANSKTGEEIKGYQFYVSTDGGSENQKYFRWEMSELWEITMPYQITDYWNGDTLIEMNFPSRCWRTGKVEDIIIASTKEFQTNSIINLPLNFTTVETDRLSVKYMLIVKQYALSEKAYYFWNGLVENTQQQGSFYDKQPYQVIGNIKCIDNPAETALGIFEASAVSTKHIFVKRPDPSVPYGFENCSRKEFADLTELERKRPYYASFTVINNYVVINKKCVDCTTTGANPVIPDNWDN